MWARSVGAGALRPLFFKFTGAEESVTIFSKHGMRARVWLRTDVAELIASRRVAE